ncbi:4'-phosphopantetheinyl transferase family protein [Arthrobacter sp. CDRTa11]|uniref:4'-phosphopantetheinyl transferase family protein n=1 Tax=Arthrobacter sp. CDRTa11 TaxID=2651199 RepID=UPI00226594B4|nr:4'-phosphopantetheinyl transferase superfamily protein [Arthrobacter sp. CDRTa11]
MRDTEIGGALVRAAALAAPGPAELKLLDSSEHRRAATFHNPADAADFLAGRAALRLFAAELAGTSPAALVAAYRCTRCGGGEGDHGQPGYLLQDGGAGPLLSLSRADGWVVLAGAADGGSLSGIGVDVEQAGRTAFPGFDALVLTPRERTCLAPATTAEGRGQRARFWTRKEAFLKSTGEGLGRDPATCDVTAERLEGALLADLEPARLGLPSGTVAALALRQE